MKKLKKPLAAASIICIAVATALLATWLSAIVEGGDPTTPEPYAVTDEDGRRQIDWDALPETVIAWVEVPGTSIDEPIVQATPDAPNVYLRIDALEQGAYGTPYIDYECTFDSKFVMIYGHHMSDGSAFADFAKFIDEGYAREHSEIIVYRREEETLRLKVVAVDVVNANHERLNTEQDLAPTKRISGADLVLEDADGVGQLFAFATCSYQTWNSRTVVYAS